MLVCTAFMVALSLEMAHQMSLVPCSYYNTEYH